MQVLVAEPSAPIANALRKFLDGSAEVRVVRFLDEAVQATRSSPPDLVFASVSGTFDGELLCGQVKKIAPTTLVVLLYPPHDAELAPRRAAQADASAFLIGPLKRYNVLSVLRLCEALREQKARAENADAHVAALQSEVVRLKGQFDEQQKQLASAAAAATASAAKAAKPAQGPGINTADEAFFKKYMLLEVKRSKRYQYPVALLLVELDRLGQHLAGEKSPDFQRAAIRSEALKALSELLRDIDIAMPFADEKYLVFLPHTPPAGAQVVAKRVLERLRRLPSFTGGTASVGVAHFDPKTEKPEDRSQVSFGRLVREASEQLKKAQAGGGDRVEAKPIAVPPEPAKPKKNRIVLG